MKTEISLLLALLMGGCTLTHNLRVSDPVTIQSGDNLSQIGRYEVIGTWQTSEQTSKTKEVMIIDTADGHLYRWTEYNSPEGPLWKKLWWLHYEGRLRPGTAMHQLLDQAP